MAELDKGTKATSFKELSPKQKKQLQILGGVAALVAIYTATKKPTTTVTPSPVTPVSGVPPGTGGAGVTPGITPGVPVSLTQTGATNSSITLTWTPVDNAVNYLLYDYTTNLLIGQSSTNTITINGLQANTHYTWYVEAQSVTGQASGASTPATVATSSNVQAGTVPSVPQALTVTASTATSVSFAWADVAGATYYQITTLPAGQTGGGQVLSPINGTTATVSGLSPNVQYQFSLQACNAVGCSNPSGLTLATTTTGHQVQSIAVTPGSANVQINQTQQFTATATNSDGTTNDVTSTATWTSNSQATATINSTGLATAIAVGATTVSACVGTICGYGIIAVEPTSVTPTTKTLASISVSPASITMNVGLTRQMMATGKYSDGSSSDVTGQVTWSSTNNSVVSVNSSGLISAVSPSTVNITACISGVCGSSTATVQQSAIQQAAVAQQAAQTAQQQALQRAQQIAAQYAASAAAQAIGAQQQQQHNTYAQQSNYGSLVNQQNVALPNSLVVPGASIQSSSTYYNPNNNTYNYLTTNNAGGRTGGQYVPVTTGVTNAQPGQNLNLIGSQCITGTLNGKTGSWDGYGSFHPGCSDCSCPVGG